MRPGDIVAMPLKHTSGIALGRVTSEYKFQEQYVTIDAAHTRDVKWVRTNVPRSSFGQDLLYSLGAFMTVCNVTRNNAAERIESILNGGTDNVIGAAALSGEKVEQALQSDGVPELARNLEDEARATIMEHVIRRFKGHDLQSVVQAVLEAQGYVVNPTDKGADGGIDLTAGRGDLGFDPPRIGVQVKSEAGRVDVKPVRELDGALKNFGADHGLFVAWGGFTGPAVREARRNFFRLRLWTGFDLVTELLKVYPLLSEEMQTLIPLQQIWTLIPPEDESRE